MRRGGGGVMEMSVYYSRGEEGGGVMEMSVYYSRGEEGGGGGYGDVCIVFPG